MKAPLARWLLIGEWRDHPLRALMAIAAITLGVALGFAIDLINAAAFNEFSAAARSLSGQSDLQVRAPQPSFDEALYPELAQRAGVAAANPVLEIDAALPDRQGSLKILGIDVFRAAQIAPDLLGVPAKDRPFDTLMDDAIFLSPAAMTWLNLKAGDTITLRAGASPLRLRVAGGINRARPGQRIAVMDLGAAQWRFGLLGRLSRVELKLAPGVDRAAFRAQLARDYAGRLIATEPEDSETRTANMSRAYRVNLNVLALVALFTGAFLVFSTQALSVIRRRQQFALLRVLGTTRRGVLVQVLLEGAVLGVIGSAVGILAGYGIAAIALRAFGGDLGGGYFPGVQPSVQFRPLTAAIFFCAGSLVAILGSATPAWEAARARPAPALKAGSEDVALAKLARPWPALLCLLLGATLTRLPPVHGLPVFGYLAVALLLIGGIALMPRFAAIVFSAAGRIPPQRVGTVGALALARLANAPNAASIALGGVLSSFALMVAMGIMVSSFRVSVDDWLVKLLPADLYVRSAGVGDVGALDAAAQRALAAVPGVARADFQRFVPLTLTPARPAVMLIARNIDADDPGRALPLTGEQIGRAQWRGMTPVWVSEAMVDLYGDAVGKTITLPSAAGERRFIVAGVWRDYARQTGAIQMRLADYQAWTGDATVNDAALLLAKGATVSAVSTAIRALPFGATLELAEPGQIRAMSLRIFDRSFAVTYLLEAVAIIIGLFGVAATFSAQTLARAKEFGMLRHVGVTRSQVLAMLAAEGGLLALSGIAVGFALGWCISLILVFIVNPQSFHWTMQLHMPWGLLASVATALLVSAAGTALVAGRQAVAGNAVRSVREDW
ncbi:FtsX-like permease family protein [Noviherbaspirillum pedocola]|uniref:ABC transporter permease n=1 Tax=Noviherbaspirillum pedocola TaxID=2801341 RepID=A0A934SXJ8_9BURK|nr:FtsX-like permease family protein [Noviherbaspirillum pedocola]MBK4737509.1 ABC transporter permease [Noviherbaspirillum pedocola]